MKEPANRHRSLVSPNESILIVVDGSSDPTTDDDGMNHEDLVEIASLIGMAHDHSVPVIFASNNLTDSPSGLHAALGKSIRRSEIIGFSDANPWGENDLQAAVHAANRPRVIVAGRPSEVCVTFAVLSALEEGYEVYVATDATSGASREHHMTAISRMVQAGAVPVTTRQIIFEWQRGLRTIPELPDARKSNKSRPKKP